MTRVKRSQRSVRAGLPLFLCVVCALPFLAGPAARSAAQTQPPRYDGSWWLSLGGWEQYGSLSGYIDCYTNEYRGSVPFIKDVQFYSDALTQYFQSGAEKRQQTVSVALDAIRGAANDSAQPAGAGGGGSGSAYDGRFWFDADTAAQLGFLEGYIACHTAKLKDADAKFSKPPADYINPINEAYGITDDSDDVDADKAPVRIADVLHRLKDSKP